MNPLCIIKVGNVELYGLTRCEALQWLRKQANPKYDNAVIFYRIHNIQK
jgi:hypothetical protein